MTQISQKKEKYTKKGYFDEKKRNFHKSKVDGLQKLPTRACLFEDFLHFKGWPYINHKISIDFADKFMIFFGLLDLFYDYPLDFGSIIHPQFFFLYMGYFDSVGCQFLAISQQENGLESLDTIR